MARHHPNGVLQFIRSQVADPHAGELTDRELLHRFAVARDEHAFRVLFRRHGSMVFRVCQRWFGCKEDAEDVFQAVFLVLAQKAGSLKWPESVGSWLYGVAHRLAQETRRKRRRRQNREAKAAPQVVADPLVEITAQELLAILDEEVAELPERVRAPLLLCYLEGRTADEAARELGCSVRTLKRRLHQARELLQRRLQRRDLALSSAALSVLLLQQTAPASVPATLVVTTMRAAGLVAAGQPLTAGPVSAEAIVLAQGVMQMMFATKLKTVLGVCLVLSGLLAGTVALARSNFLASNPQASLAYQPRPTPRHQPQPNALAVALPPLPSRGSQWSALVPVSPERGGKTLAGDPDIAVSPITGLPYVVFQATWNLANGNDYLIGFSRPTRKGRTFDWSETQTVPIEVSPRSRKNLHPVIAVGSRDGKELVHVVWFEHIGREDMVYSRSSDGGKTWSEPLNLSESGKALGTASLLADDQGNVFVIWSDWTGNANQNGLDIWLRKFDGAKNAWLPKRKVEADAKTKSSFPRIVRDIKGRLHFAWADRVVKPPRLCYCTSDDGGETFSDPEKVFEAPLKCDLQGAALAVTPDGTLYLAGQTPPSYGERGPTHLWLMSKAAGAKTWSEPEQVPGSDPCANPYLAADASGRVFLSWLRYLKGDYDLMVRFRNSLGWSGPARATHGGTWKGYTGGHVAVDRANGFLFVVTDDTPEQRHRVYVAALDLQAPPRPVTGLKVQPGAGKNELTWRNPDDPDLGGVRVVFRTDRPPVSALDGAIAVERTATCNQDDRFLHESLTEGTTYYYAVYTLDDTGNYSPAVRATGKTAPAP